MGKTGMRIAALTILILSLTVCGALGEILPPDGPGQYGFPAVVLCNSLTVRESMNTKAASVKTLRVGTVFYTQQIQSGWAEVFMGESEEGRLGWVLSDYIAVDPSWYKCEASTPVYAWGDTSAPKVALLDRGTKLPLLKDMGDWVVVSLRGASGWIQKTAKDQVSTARRVEIGELNRADLITANGVYSLYDANGLNWIIQNFSGAEATALTGCSFDCTLILYQKNGQTVVVNPATDGCPYYKTAEGSCFAYGDRDAALRQYGSTAIIAQTFYSLFGLSVDSLSSGGAESL